MAKLLTLSIVIPVYNEEHHLGACLDSIAAQTVKPNEVIVVDNNSTDQSADIAKSYPFVTVLHESYQGVVFARNHGFNVVKSDIIGRIDADTVLPTNWVERVKKFYSTESNHNKALTGGGYFYNVRLPGFNGWAQSQLAYRLNRFIVGFYILWGSNMAIPKHIWDEVRGKVCLRNDLHEDMDLAIHVHRAGYHITYRANLRAGMYMKRFLEDRDQQRAHTARWPRTLRVHDFRNWWLGSVGNVVILYVLQPFALFLEGFGRLMGRRLK